MIPRRRASEKELAEGKGRTRIDPRVLALLELRRAAERTYAGMSGVS